MKLSRAAWNNVIIICVIAMILLINLTNERLFPDQSGAGQYNTANQQGEYSLLGEHAVILTLSINDHVFIERLGQAWQVKRNKPKTPPTGKTISQQLIEQTVRAWQQSRGLLQASSIEIKGLTGIPVTIFIAGQSQAKTFWLYLLSDQLLIKTITEQNQEQWLAFPKAIYPQLIPQAFE